MAVLNAGDVKSGTKENGLLEMAMMLQDAEDSFVPAAGEVKQNRVQLSINVDSGLATISAVLPLTTVIGSDGSVRHLAKTYC
jgi:hypothetical protein